MLFENMSMAFSAIRANKMRSFLTMLGIIIGIGSVISIVSVGDSMRAMFADLYENVGITQSVVYVDWIEDDFRQSDLFTLDEMERVQEVFGDEITYIDCSSSASGEGFEGRNKIKVEASGVDYNYFQIQPENFIYGRGFLKSDVKARKNNAILEEQGAIKLFGTSDAVGRTFRTTLDNGQYEFTVIGVYRKEMTPLEVLMMGNSRSETIYIPYTLLTTSDDYFGGLHLYVREDIDLNDFASRMRQLVARMKDRTPEQIVYTSAADELSSVDSMMGGLAAAVGGIAAISLLVGGIGIMNIMLVSVTERTREIGIRKALGARTQDILVQFLTESAILSALGGIIGILIGAGLVYLGGYFMGVQVVVRSSVVLVSVSFSAIVGIFFGLYPASRAAKADPIDALRYE